MFLKNRVSTKGATLAGFGIAIGMSYQNCEREMQLALTTPYEKGRRKKVKGEDDCLDLEDKKAGNMSSDRDVKGNQPEELKNDKSKQPVDLKKEKAKKVEDEKKLKAEDSMSRKAKKGVEPKKYEDKKADVKNQA